MKQVSIVLLMFVFLITGVSVQAQSPVQVNQIQEKPHKLQPQLDKVNLQSNHEENDLMNYFQILKNVELTLLSLGN